FTVARIDCLAIQRNATLLWLDRAANQAQQGGLSASRAAHDRGDAAAAEFQRYIGKDHTFVITERNVIDVEKRVGTQGLTEHRRSETRVPLLVRLLGAATPLFLARLEDCRTGVRGKR